MQEQIHLVESKFGMKPMLLLLSSINSFLELLDGHLWDLLSNVENNPLYEARYIVLRYRMETWRHLIVQNNSVHHNGVFYIILC